MPAAALLAAMVTAGVAPSLTWHAEHDPGSTAEIGHVEPDTWTLTYRLGGGRPTGQFAALVFAVPGGVGAYDRVTFTARADHPLRIAVQLRPAGGNNPPRWQRSVYLDAAVRTITVTFADLHPVPPTAAAAAPLAAIDALMFVVDTNNTAPGTAGVVTIGAPLWGALH